MKWINIKKEKPIWYRNVDIKVDGEIKLNWHRLNGDNNDIYYGSLETDKIIYETDVTHWRENKND